MFHCAKNLIICSQVLPNTIWKSICSWSCSVWGRVIRKLLNSWICQYICPIIEWYEVLPPESIYFSVFKHHSCDYVLNIIYDTSSSRCSWLLGLSILWALDKSSHGKMALYVKFLYLDWLNDEKPTRAWLGTMARLSKWYSSNGNNLNIVCESVMSYSHSNMCICKSADIACIR